MNEIAFCQDIQNDAVIVDQQPMMEIDNTLILTSSPLDNALGEDISYGSSPFANFSNKNDNNTTVFHNIQSRKQKSGLGSSFKNSIEYKILIQHFSSGVTLHELFSIATIISSNLLLGLRKPGRDEQRNFSHLIRWYQRNWEQIFPILPFIQLRDKNFQEINGRREVIEKCLKS